MIITSESLVNDDDDDDRDQIGQRLQIATGSAQVAMCVQLAIPLARSSLEFCSKSVQNERSFVLGRRHFSHHLAQVTRAAKRGKFLVCLQE